MLTRERLIKPLLAAARRSPLGQAFRFGEGEAPLVWRLALAVWVAVLIVTPISLWVFREAVFPAMATLGVLAQAAVTLLALARAWPPRRLLFAAAIILVGTWAVEWLGSSTGFPFGHYHYTGALQPQAFGVPLLIPFAWLMMLGPAWAVADVILSGQRTRLGRWYVPLFALLAGAAFTAWDFYLDPQMVNKGLWLWELAGGYFGIPWVNFAGWWLSAALLTVLVRPADLPRVPLVLVYALTWVFQAVGLGVFWGQPGPALVGFVVMGVFVLWAWLRLLPR